MRINFVLTLISLAIAALLGWMCYAIVGSAAPNALIAGIGSGVCFAVPLLTAIGFSFESEGTGMNIRTLSFVMFFVMLAAQLIFAFTHISMPTYAIVSGILLLIHIAVVYMIARANQ